MAPRAKCAPPLYLHSCSSFLKICVAASEPGTYTVQARRTEGPLSLPLPTCRPHPSSTSSACLGSQPRARLYRRRPAVHGLLHATRRLRHLLPPRIARRPPRAAPQPLRLPCLQPLIVLLIPDAQTRESCASRATSRARRARGAGEACEHWLERAASV
ncbi:hypothetical protein C8J57DRAFT_1358000 [Mycena rebaudengoi]|nr:hypothetical protein C8J57DRAFT_1358000 [Mycena rebaudengoi]